MKTFLCIATYHKGVKFLEALKKCGHKVIFITSNNLKNENWPWHAIDEVYYLEEQYNNVFNMDHLILGVAGLMRDQKIDRIIALDDFDVEKAAKLREIFRVPGMGYTTHRYFRDKLAMRQHAAEHGINQAKFTALFNNEDIHAFTQSVRSPWVLKPRSEASASGIVKLNSADQLWQKLEELKDERHLFLLEEFIPGEVFHVDSIVNDYELLFNSCSQYLVPPLNLVNEGGIFQSVTCEYDSDDEALLQAANQKLLKNFGLRHGASHSEYIKSKDGQFHFLETSARVAGARLCDMIEAATSINIWTEWAKIESSLLESTVYQIPQAVKQHAGILMAAIHQERADYSDFNAKEVIWHASEMKYHIGLIIKSPSRERVLELMEIYRNQIAQNYLN